MFLPADNEPLSTDNFAFPGDNYSISCCIGAFQWGQNALSTDKESFSTRNGP